MRLAATDRSGNGGRKDVIEHRKADLLEKAGGYLDRSGSRNSCCRSICATVDLFETT
jgi:hypothetical protein